VGVFSRRKLAVSWSPTRARHRGHQNRIEGGEVRAGLHRLVDELGRLLIVAGEDALVEDDVLIEAGVVLDEDPDELEPLTVCENTTSHTVRGIARASPIGPHSHVQNATEISSAIDETPALLAKNKGSRTKAMIVSVTTKSPTMSSGVIQPSKTARLRRTGIEAATQAPAYGMKRSSAAKTPTSARTEAQHEEPDRDRDAEARVEGGLRQQVPG